MLRTKILFNLNQYYLKNLLKDSLELSPASEIMSKGFKGVAGFKGDGILYKLK